MHFLTRLWGQEQLTFAGHEWKVPFEVDESFEDMDDETLRSYDAVIVPSGMVSDRLRYTEDVAMLPPATEFLQRAFAEPTILKGIICHGMWLVAPTPELVRGRPVVVHNNLHGDVVNMGAVYTDEDVVVDGDLVTARTGGHCHLFARRIIELLAASAVQPAESSDGHDLLPHRAQLRGPDRDRALVHEALRLPPRARRRAGPQIIIISRAASRSSSSRPRAPRREAAAEGRAGVPGRFRHLAFLVDDLDAKLAEMGDDAQITLGPLDMGSVHPGHASGLDLRPGRKHR